MVDLSYWNGHDTRTNVYEWTSVQCPECKEWRLASEWSDCEVDCEDCGSHAAVRCPSCQYAFDHVHGPFFETKQELRND